MVKQAKVIVVMLRIKKSAQSSPSAGGQGNVGTQASFGESDRNSSQSTVYGPTRPSDKPPKF